MARDLQLGLNVGYWGAGPPPGIEATIAEAEQLGFDSLWTAEAYGSDVLTPLAWWGVAHASGCAWAPRSCSCRRARRRPRRWPR